MKKILVALALAAFASAAQATIAGGAASHNLSTGAADIGACQYCHAPHLWTASNIGTGIALWNKNAPAAQTFTVYTSNNITLAEVTLGNGSKACLVCHDGVTTMGLTVNGPTGATNTVISTAANANVNIGQNLTNDHPVGVVYNTANALNANTGSVIGGFKLFDDNADGTYTLECASCHNPHADSDGAASGLVFLRTPTTDKCLDCHNK